MSKTSAGKTNGAGAKDAEATSRESLELPMVDLPGSHPCHSCGDCCSYIATEIDNPTTFSDYENIHWYLTHRNISVYIDEESDWFIEFRTQCEHLSEARTCEIYSERPKICSEFSWTECEKNSNERAWKYYFTTYQDLLDWMQKKRPKAFESYTKGRRKLLEKREKAAIDETTRKAVSRPPKAGPADGPTPRP